MSAEYRKVKVTLVRSPIAYSDSQQATVKALGLRRMHQTVVHNETPQIKGMIFKVKHMVSVEEVQEG